MIQIDLHHRMIFLSIIAHNTNTNNDESEDDGNIPKRWIDGYKNIGTSEEREATVEKIVHAQMMKYCLKKFQVNLLLKINVH